MATGNSVPGSMTGTANTSTDTVAPTGRGQANGYASLDATAQVPASQLGHAGGGSGGLSLTQTTVKTSAYTASAGQIVPVDTTSGSVTVTLPNAPAPGVAVAVKHVIQGGTNTVTVACAGSDVYNKTGGGTTLTLALASQGALLEYNGGIWVVLADDLPLGQLDTRYTTAAALTTETARASAAEAAATASALNSATTVVNIATATAPSTGQVLTATGGTAATWQTPAGSGGTPLILAGVKTANYTATAGQAVPCDISGGSFTVTLPNAPAAGTMTAVEITAVSGTGVNALTVTCAGSGVLDAAGGAASVTLTLLHQAQVFVYGGGVWARPAGRDSYLEVASQRTGTVYLDQYTGTDDAKMTAALTAVFAAGGGTIQLSPRAHTFANQWLTTWTGATPDVGITICGTSPCFQSSLGNTPSGSTKCTFTYAGAGAGQINFQHAGSYELANMLLADGAASTVPFIFSTNPAGFIHDCAFTSSTGTGATCVKDAIQFGASAATTLSGTGDTKGFQGYGSDVRNCYFDRIRHAVIFGAAANSVTVHHNSIATTCGDSSPFGAPFIFAGNATYSTNANQVDHNLIEAIHYGAVARANTGGYAAYNSVGPNTVWDTTYVTALAVMDATSTGNFVDATSYLCASQEAVYDPALGTAVLTNHRPGTWTTQQEFTTAPVVRSQGLGGFASENYFGGRAWVSTYGPASHPLSNYPTCAQISTNTPTQVSDGVTISGSPYVTSATAAFAAADRGEYLTAYTAGIPPNAKIAFHYDHSQTFITWQASATPPLGSFATPVTLNGHLYQCTTAGGASGTTEPAWPTGGGTVTDGSNIWTDLGTTATGALLTQTATASTTANTFSFGRTSGLGTQMFYLHNHHIGGTGLQTTWAAQTAAGTGATITRSGYDIGQQVTLTTGTGSTAGLLAIGTPGQATTGYSQQIISITPCSAAAAGLNLWGDMRATSTYKISCVNTPADSTVYVFNIIMIG